MLLQLIGKKNVDTFAKEYSYKQINALELCY